MPNPPPTLEERAREIVRVNKNVLPRNVIFPTEKGLQEMVRDIVAALRAVERETWESMMPYLTHRVGCQWLNEDTATHPRRCTCGFEEIRRRALSPTE